LLFLCHPQGYAIFIGHASPKAEDAVILAFLSSAQNPPRIPEESFLSVPPSWYLPIDLNLRYHP